MKIQQIQSSDVWECLESGEVVWVVEFHTIASSHIVKLNEQTIQYINDLLDSESDNNLFFKYVEPLSQ